MRKRQGGENETVTENNQGMGDVSSSTIDRPKKKRTVRYWLVRTNEVGEVCEVIREYKSKMQAQTFLDAGRAFGPDAVRGVRVLKGKLIEE
jgi:hypothetical protein